MIGFIAVGIIVVIVRWWEYYSQSKSRGESNSKQPSVGILHLFISMAGCFILLGSFVAPSVDYTYGMTRVFFQMAGILAVYFIIGGLTLAKYLKQYAFGLILLVLIPFFLCNSGLVDVMFNRPFLLLSSEGTDYYNNVIQEQDSCAARWLRTNGELNNTDVFADSRGSDWLICQAWIYPGCDSTSLFDKNKSVDGYIYLRYDNVVNNRLYNSTGQQFALSDIQDKLLGKGKIYDNCGAQIYH